MRRGGREGRWEKMMIEGRGEEGANGREGETGAHREKVEYMQTNNAC